MWPVGRSVRSHIEFLLRFALQLPREKPEVAPPIGTPLPGGESTVPPAPPVTQEDVSTLASWLRRMKQRSPGGVVCITGAGLSTESGIPDYRSPNGAYSSGFKPMTHQDFMRTGVEGMSNRKKYWIRSFAGWSSFSGMEPNSGHVALAELQQAGYIREIITQNVDRLHHKAGSVADRVLELHGTTHQVRCMDCETVYPREDVQRLIVRMNGGALNEDGTIGLGNLGIAATLGVTETNGKGTEQGARGERRTASSKGGDGGKEQGGGAFGARQGKRDGEGMRPRQNPDGDVEIRNTDAVEFKTPVCMACRGGLLKPDVVFFGDSLPKERTEESLTIAKRAAGILVVGSSLQVMSAYRLVQQAKEFAGAEVFIVTIGETRADPLADYKVDKLAGELLPQVVSALHVEP